MRSVWDNAHLLMYCGGLFLGASAMLMGLWTFDQLDSRPIPTFLTGISLAGLSAILLERGFRLLVQSHERVEALIEELHRKATTPWAD